MQDVTGRQAAQEAARVALAALVSLEDYDGPAFGTDDVATAVVAVLDILDALRGAFPFVCEACGWGLEAVQVRQVVDIRDGLTLAYGDCSGCLEAVPA